MGLRPVLGRLLTPADDGPGAAGALRSQSPRLLQRGPSLAGGAGVRSYIVRHVGGRRGVHVDGDVSAQIQSGQFVPFRLGNRLPIADEDHRRFDGAVQPAARAQRCVLTNRQWLFLPVSNEREPRLLRNQSARLEFHRLPIAGDAPVLQPIAVNCPST
jgi:hypothetical protein